MDRSSRLPRVKSLFETFVFRGRVVTIHGADRIEDNDGFAQD